VGQKGGKNQANHERHEPHATTSWQGRHHVWNIGMRRGLSVGLEFMPVQVLHEAVQL